MSDNTKLSKDGLNQVWLKAMTILKSLTGNVKTEKGTLQEQIDLLEENASSGVDLTQAEYDALPDTKESDGVDYYIMDEDFVATDAKAVGYDNSTSGLTRETAQGAIDEIVDKINESNTNFNNGLDELNSNLNKLFNGVPNGSSQNISTNTEYTIEQNCMVLFTMNFSSVSGHAQIGFYNTSGASMGTHQINAPAEATNTVHYERYMLKGQKFKVTTASNTNTLKYLIVC